MTGYEVFYQFGFNPLVSVVNTTTTAVNITSGLMPGATYTFSVLSYGSTALPSDLSTATMTFCK